MAVAWLICSAVMARAQTPTIVSAIVNSATKQITITGTSLTATGAPVVKLDSTTLALVPRPAPKSSRICRVDWRPALTG